MYKTYGIKITALGTTYYFVVDNLDKAREVYEGSHSITRFEITEETHEIGQATVFRTMSDREVADAIFDLDYDPTPAGPEYSRDFEMNH
jgi:hypothetical protein